MSISQYVSASMKKPSLFGRPAGRDEDGADQSAPPGRAREAGSSHRPASQDPLTQPGRGAAPPDPRTGGTMADPKSPAPNFPSYRGLGGGGEPGGAPGGPGAAGMGRAPMPGVPAASSPESEGSKLIVGRNIRLKGEIEACDTLVVEGYVEASMSSRIIEIAEGGTFKGD